MNLIKDKKGTEYTVIYGTIKRVEPKEDSKRDTIRKYARSHQSRKNLAGIGD